MERWRTQTVQNQLAPLGQFVSVPKPIGRCSDQTPTASTFSKYEQDRVFDALINQTTAGQVRVPLFGAYPTVQLNFSAALRDVQQFSSAVSYDLRLVRDFQTQSVWMRVATSGTESAVVEKLQIDCGTLLKIPSHFQVANTPKTFYFQLAQVPALCTVDGQTLQFSAEELAWQPATLYASECDARFHAAEGALCFSGCANDTIKQVLGCEQDCAKFGEARPVFLTLENRCITRADARQRGMVPRPAESLVQNQYGDQKIVCVNGTRNPLEGAEQIPCICVEGHSQTETAAGVLRMCVKDQHFPLSVEDELGAGQLAAIIGGQISEAFQEIGDALGKILGGMFGEWWTKWLAGIGAVVGAVVVGLVAIKCVMHRKTQKVKAAVVYK